MKVIVSLFFVAGSMSLLGYLLYFPAVWPLMITSLLLLWVPFFMKRNEGFKKWALFNVRSSHLFFAILIVLLFIQPANRLTASAPKILTAEYCLGRLEQLQSKGDGFYPAGVFPTPRSWLSRAGEEDNGVFGTATIAYILRTTNERRPNARARMVLNRAISSFEKYRNRHGEASYNFWPTDNLPFPNGGLLSREQYRLPDDYDDTALIQLARGPNPMDQSVRDKMLNYAMRAERNAVEHFPSGHRSKKVYETWYADKMQQELDIVVMANVLLFVIEKGYPLETPDRHTIDCLKTSIDESWYFGDTQSYAPYYKGSAMILYCLARLIDKDTTGEFTAERGVLIRHLRQALDQSDHAIEKMMIASSLLRLGESVDMDLSRDQVMHDASSFVLTIGKTTRLLPAFYWRCEAVSWALVYEFLSFNPTIRWK